jgi:glycosyltransferase involved in cell wall biosynthesis
MTPEPGSNTPNIGNSVESPRRIIYDGLNLTPDQGTGIPAYTRLLTHIARSLGYDVGVVCGTTFTPDKDALLQEVLFFDQMRAPHQLDRKVTPSGTLNRALNRIIDQVRYNFALKPLPLRLGDAVIDQHHADSFAEHDRAFVARNLFDSANAIFNRTSRFINLSFDPTPDMLHCTWPVPLRVRSACNIYTIHTLMSLQSPFGTFERKKINFRLLKKIANTADHIVTASEASRRDIVRILNVDERRVTNAYTAVTFPQKYLERSEQAVENYLDGLYGLEMNGYLLFLGSSEPKKNVHRLIDAFLSSDVDIPLVLVAAPGWHHADELNRPSERKAPQRAQNAAASQVRCLKHVGLSALVSLIRGARAVVFAPLYEGFSLPILEAMMLGTPVVAATSGALTEISGDAALLVDPYDIDDIAQALTTIVNDADLRRELSQRGTAQAAKFSVARYRERIRLLYASLA